MVGGDGQDQARDILAVVDNARIADSISNKREGWTDSRKVDAFAAGPPPNGIDQAVEMGQRRLKEKGIRRDFSFILTDNPSTRYGREFGLGDLISAQFDVSLQDFQIREVEINYSAHGHETVKIILGPLDGTFWKSSDAWEQMVALIKDIETQVEEATAAT